MEDKHRAIYVKRSQRDYSLSFKLGVVGEVERGELSQRGAARKYGIQGDNTIGISPNFELVNLFLGIVDSFSGLKIAEDAMSICELQTSAGRDVAIICILVYQRGQRLLAGSAGRERRKTFEGGFAPDCPVNLQTKHYKLQPIFQHDPIINVSSTNLRLLIICKLLFL